VSKIKRILDKTNMTESDWQEYRRNQKGIGGSEAATILGLNPYQSEFTLWLEKTGKIARPPLNNQYIEWGNLLEPLIREKFRQETGFDVVENHFVLQHDTHEFMIANIDGEVIDPQFNGKTGILEIKTANERMKKDWEEGCPNHYMVQIQHYLGVTDYLYAYVAVLIGGNDFRYFLIHRDDYVIDQLISAEMEFQRKVDLDISPEISGHTSDSDYLAATYAEDNGEELYISSLTEKKAIRYHSIQKEIKTLQEEADALKNQIKLQAGRGKIFKGEKIKISMPTVKKKAFDSKAFSIDHPELYGRYKTKESTYRNFTVNLLK
jgi:putative phage-type endonuclease